MSDMTDGTWEFYDNWAAFPFNRVLETDRRIVGEFYVSTANRDESVGPSGGFGIRFYQFHERDDWRPTEIAARLEAFGDAWAAIASNPELVAALGILGEQDQQTPETVRKVLLCIGMTDVTAKLRGTHPATCITCGGKGVLDDVAPAETETTHRCPPGDAAVTPCCGRTPFELPRTDRMTLDPALVTCHPSTEETT